jgi:acetyl/propionyl-CoA carboxylase alpha subunit
MLAKLIVHGSDRSDALRRMSDALAAFRQTGVDTTLGFLRALIERPEVLSNEVNTRWVETVLQDPDFLGRLERERQ